MKQRAKKQKNSTFNTLKLKVSPHPNGFRCDGSVLPIPSNKIRVFDLILGGKDEVKIKENQEEELKNLQKQNINASIMSSNAAVSTSKATKWGAIFTLVLVILTGFYVVIMGKILKQGTESKKKESNDELIESIYEPIRREANSVIYIFENIFTHSKILTPVWDHGKNNIKNLVKIDSSFRDEIKQFYQNIENYNESLILIRERIFNSIRDMLRSNQQPTDLAYKKLRGSDPPIEVNFVDSILIGKHPRTILERFRGIKEGWSIPNNAIFDSSDNKKIDDVHEQVLRNFSNDEEFLNFIQLRTIVYDTAKQLKERLEIRIINLQ